MPPAKKPALPKCQDLVTAILQLKQRWLKVTFREKERFFMHIADMAAKLQKNNGPPDTEAGEPASE